MLNAREIKEIKDRHATAGDRCWAFNDHPTVKSANPDLETRVRLIVAHGLASKESNARIETLGYLNNDGDRIEAKRNAEFNITARPKKSV